MAGVSNLIGLGIAQSSVLTLSKTRGHLDHKSGTHSSLGNVALAAATLGCPLRLKKRTVRLEASASGKDI